MENNELKINTIGLTTEAETYAILLDAFVPLTENDGRDWAWFGDIDMLKLAFIGLLLECDDREKLDFVYKFLLNPPTEEEYAEEELSDEVKNELDRRLELLDKETLFYDPFEVLDEIREKYKV